VVTIGGMFGVAGKKDSQVEILHGTDYHSHLGTRRGGMAVFAKDELHRTIHNIENDNFRSKFEPDLNNLVGNIGIGVISDTDSQPVIQDGHLGKTATTVVGKIHNIDEIREYFHKRKEGLSESNQGMTPTTEMVARLINHGDSIVDGIKYSQEKIQGSASILVMTKDGIYAARDKLGRTPLIIGRGKEGFAVAFESFSFQKTGFNTEKDLGPGEVVFLNPDGYETLKKPGKKSQICAFLWVYYGYPASYYEGINVEKTRNRCGKLLAENDDVVVDIVAGIPDSGTGHALGYANARKIPYQRPYVKYTPTWPRSFMPQNQKLREKVAKMKLIVIPELVKNKNILFCEDSIVRGTQLRDNVSQLFDEGASSVHMRPACPTLTYACDFLNFSTSKKIYELAGRRAIRELEGTDEVSGETLAQYSKSGTDENLAMIERIGMRLGLTTLKYQKLDDLVSAISLPKEKLCTHCWDGSSHF